jgi:hypothetical protein
MLGFSNAYLDENRMINDTRNFIRQEQVTDDEDTNIKKRHTTCRYK